MSWLLVALIPGLLMLATVGLERLESSLGRDAITPADVAEFLEQAKAGESAIRPRVDPDGALPHLAPQLSVPMAPFDEWIAEETAPDSPMSQCAAPGPKTGFQQTRHADRV